MNKTNIEWVKNPDGSQGYTWNPITGCLNNCSYCYARKLAEGRLRSRYLANSNVAPFPDFIRGRDCLTNPFYPRFWPERLGEPQALGGGMFGLATIPKGIFTCDMSDLFGVGIPEDWPKQVMAVIEACPQHRFYLLTKQPQNLAKFSPFPNNCWVGVTATGTAMYWNALAELQYIKASVKYVSLEPLLEPIKPLLSSLNYSLKKAGISWVILGSQTKPYRPPTIKAVEEIVEVCNKANIPIFIKENLKPFLDTQPTRIVYQYGSGKLRQELPRC